MSNATRSHHTNVFIICGGVIVLMINLIIVVAVLIAVVYIRRRKMNTLAAAAANSVENPLYSGGQLDRMWRMYVPALGYTLYIPLLAQFEAGTNWMLFSRLENH